MKSPSIAIRCLYYCHTMNESDCLKRDHKASNEFSEAGYSTVYEKDQPKAIVRYLLAKLGIGSCSL